MFYKYEIINNGKEDILYLYLDMKYEFSKEFISNDFKDLSIRTRNFIDTNKINFKGKKVYLIVNGIVVKTVDVSDTNNSQSISNDYSPDSFIVNIELNDHSIKKVSLREYLLNQLHAFYNKTLHTEVLKSICILFNTYAYKMMKENRCIPFNDYFSYYDINDDYNKFDSDEVIDYLNLIINEVANIFITYKNEYILPFVHFSNNGSTLSNKKYPYLSNIKCLWDLTSPKYISFHDYDFNYISNVFDTKISNNSNIKIINKYNEKLISIDNKIFSFEEFKRILNLESPDFYIIIYSNYLRIITCGCGNFYGLSLYSANEIAKNGSKYYNILSYFFPKTKLYRYTKKEQ